VDKQEDRLNLTTGDISKYTVPGLTIYPYTPTIRTLKIYPYTPSRTATGWLNLRPTFADRGVSRVQRGGSPTVVNLSFIDRSCYFLTSSSSFILTRAEWAPFQNHYYSENVGIEPRTSGLAARNSEH
jgi:hypothetical protein